VAEPARGNGPDPIEVVPVVVLSQVFPARPSSIPDIRDFVRRCLAESPLTDEGNREVGDTVFRALLDAAGPTGSIQVAFRIFPEHVEVDVLHSDNQILAPVGMAGTPAAGAAPATPTVRAAPAVAPAVHAPPAQDPAAAGNGPAPSQAAPPAPPAPEPATAAAATEPVPAQAAPTPPGPIALGQPGHPATFAEWMSTALRREGLTQEAAARQLGVSVKTVSRWVGGATEPRMRDLRRIQEVFGQVPLP
jgi:DNA-binding XRE family transcriptional regulator